MNLNFSPLATTVTRWTNECLDALRLFPVGQKIAANANPGAPEPVLEEGHAALAWYPVAGYLIMTHVELASEDDVYSSFMVSERKGTFRDSKERAKSGGRGFANFSLRTTQNEAEALHSLLEKGIFGRSCIGGASYALRKTTGIRIPFPCSQIPTLAAMYLSAAYLLGSKRVAKVEWIGSANPLLGMIGFEIPYELIVTYLGGKITLATLQYLLAQAVGVFFNMSDVDIKDLVSPINSEAQAVQRDADKTGSEAIKDAGLVGQ